MIYERREQSRQDERRARKNDAMGEEKDRKR
jgi:hypothetical protein